MIVSPPKTSPHWTLISILSLFIFVFLTALPSIPRVPARIINMTLKPTYSRTAAWIGILGWATGIITVVVVRVNFNDAANTFNMMAGGEKSNLVATLGNGFTCEFLLYIRLLRVSLSCNHCPSAVDWIRFGRSFSDLHTLQGSIGSKRGVESLCLEFGHRADALISLLGNS